MKLIKIFLDELDKYTYIAACDDKKTKDWETNLGRYRSVYLLDTGEAVQFTSYMTFNNFTAIRSRILNS